MLRARGRYETAILGCGSSSAPRIFFGGAPHGRKPKKPVHAKFKLLSTMFCFLIVFWLLKYRLRSDVPKGGSSGWRRHPRNHPLLTTGIDEQHQEEVIAWLRSPPSQEVQDKLAELGFGKTPKNIIVIPITPDEQYLPLLFNLAISMERVGVQLDDVLLTIVDLPQPVPGRVLQLFRQLGLKYLLVSEFEPPNSYRQSIEKLTAPHCWHLRSVMNMALLKLGHRVFQMDADVVLIRDDPWSYVNPEKYNIEAAAATNPMDLTETWGGTLNCGFLSLSPSPPLVKFYEDYIVYVFQSQPDDQVALNELMDRENVALQRVDTIQSGSIVAGRFAYGDGEVQVRILDRLRFMCGQALITLEHNSRRLSRCDGNIEARALHPTHVHGTASRKIDWFRRKGQWFLKGDWLEVLNRFNHKGQTVTLSDLSNKLHPHGCLPQILGKDFTGTRSLWPGLPFAYKNGKCRVLDERKVQTCTSGSLEALPLALPPQACNSGKRCLVFLGPDQHGTRVLRGALGKIKHLRLMLPQAWSGNVDLGTVDPFTTLTVADAHLADPHAPQTFRNLQPGAVQFVVILRDPVPYVAEQIDKMMAECQMGKDDVLTAPCDFDCKQAPKETAEITLAAFTEKCKSYCKGCSDMNWLECMRRRPEVSRNPMATGMYGPQVAWWFEFFAPEQFLFVRSQDLAQKSTQEFQRLMHFIGEPVGETPDIDDFEYPKVEREDYLAEIFDHPTHELSYFLKQNGHNLGSLIYTG